MSEVFRTLEYGEDQTNKAALLIAGFMGKIEHLENAARTLANNGYNVYSYEFSPQVLTEGVPEMLPALVDSITTDFSKKTLEYDSLQPCGVSLGAGIAFETQKRYPERALPGIYAAAGADTAEGIFGYNPLFLPLKKAFKANGHELEDVKHLWKEAHQPPMSGFSIVLGGLDYIVRHRPIIKKINEWRDQGIPIQARTLWLKSHTGTINWYDKNLEELL